MSFLEILAERRQKSISVEFNFAVVFAFKHPVSAASVQFNCVKKTVLKTELNVL